MPRRRFLRRGITCQKTLPQRKVLQHFAARRRRNQSKSVFCGNMCVAENTIWSAKCGGCPLPAGAGCAQSDRSPLSKKPSGFFDRLGRCPFGRRFLPFTFSGCAGTDKILTLSDFEDKMLPKLCTQKYGRQMRTFGCRRKEMGEKIHLDRKK